MRSIGIPANDLAALLQTPQGGKLMQTLGEAGATPGHSILTLAGVGVLVAAVVTQAPSTRHR